MEVSLILKLQIELGIHLLFITIMTGYLTYIILNSKRSKMLFCYCFLHGLLILLFTCNFLAMIAPEISVRWHCLAVSHIVKLVFDVLFILYILIRFSFKSRFVKILTLVLVIAYVTAGAWIILTNPSHHLFIKEMTPYENVFGVLYYVIMGVGYILQTAGMICIIKFWIKKLDNIAYRLLSSFLALASMLFLHLYLLRIFRMSVDFFPLLILAGFTVYLIGGIKFGMFDIIPHGSRHGLELFTDALLIIGNKGEILYKNKACGLLEEKTLLQILGRFLPQPAHKPAKHKAIKMDVEIPEVNSVKHFTVTVKPIKPGLFSTGKTIFIIHDNTAILSAINRLSEKNQFLEEMNENIEKLAEDSKKLTVLSERNLLAKEIHDVMGHSLILALNTMESNKLLHGDRTVAVRRIEQAISEINSSLEEIAVTGTDGAMLSNATDLLKESREMTQNMLSERLNTLASRLSGSGILLEISSLENLTACSDKANNTIYRVCQESVTNAIKHGRATRITISVKMKDNIIELFIVDNGCGNISFTRGNGLTGMEERVNNLKGTISFRSFEDNTGFLVRAMIPV